VQRGAVVFHCAAVVRASSRVAAAAHHCSVWAVRLPAVIVLSSDFARYSKNRSSRSLTVTVTSLLTLLLLLLLSMCFLTSCRSCSHAQQTDTDPRDLYHQVLQQEGSLSMASASHLAEGGGISREVLYTVLYPCLHYTTTHCCCDHSCASVRRSRCF
jgi:cytosine/uracil/thiamine/allantoin permease